MRSTTRSECRPGAGTGSPSDATASSVATWCDESLYRRLVESCPDAVLVADREGRIRYWNAGAEKMFGYTAEHAIGESLDLIIPPSLRDRHWQGYRRVMDEGRTRYGDSLLKVPASRRDGSRISVEFYVALLRDGDGGVAGISAYLRDVTATWKESQELRSRLRALENENETLRRRIHERSE